MAWEKTPWFVGGGAWNSEFAARLLGYVAFNGNEGVLGAGDLKVSAQGTPGNTVLVQPGACCVLSRATSQAYQAYAGRATSSENVSITATTGSARHDLIVARVEDPNLAGEPWTPPVDPTIAQYIFTRVIPNVPAGTVSVAELGLGYSAIALARIDIPSSTSTITNAMIVDLRKMANPRAQRTLLTHALVIGEESTLSTATAYPVGQEFPAAVGHWAVDIPPWATKVAMIGTWSGLLAPAGAAYGYVWPQIASGGSAVYGQGVGYDTTGGTAPSRITLVAGDTVTIPSAMRGTNQTFYLRAVAESASPVGARIQATARSAIALDLEFLEVPV